MIGDGIYLPKRSLRLCGNLNTLNSSPKFKCELSKSVDAFNVQLVHVHELFYSCYGYKFMFMLHVHELLERSQAHSIQQLALKGLSSWIT